MPPLAIAVIYLAAAVCALKGLIALIDESRILRGLAWLAAMVAILLALSALPTAPECAEGNRTDAAGRGALPPRGADANPLIQSAGGEPPARADRPHDLDPNH